MIYKILVPFTIIAILAVAWFGGAAKFFKDNFGSVSNQVTSATLVPTPVETIAPVTATIAPTPTTVPTSTPPAVPSGWQTYTNSQYGFSISFPPDYKALTDKDNLYGWPKAAVLIYTGGQAYDVVIEVWNTEGEYKAAHPGENLTVYEIDGKFVTALDQTKNAETESVINTFHPTK
jgi:hypothetical protein